MNLEEFPADRFRLLLSSRELRVVVVVCAVFGFAGWWVFFHGSPSEQPASLLVGVSGSPVAGVTSSFGGSARPSTSATSIVVDVVGPVRHPGIVTIPAGSRVSDAIYAAGGLAVARVKVNLARALVDGEQVDVGAPSDPPTVGAAGIGTSGAKGNSPANGARINLNTASAEQLEQLPRVGPATAAKIIDFRTQHGGFRTVAQLQEVPGIGDRTFAQLEPLVTI